MSPQSDIGNAAQTRLIADTVAEAAIMKFAAEHPEIRKDSGFTAFQKWMFATAGALVVASILWVVSTVNQMQLTLTRLDERIASGGVKDARVDDLDRRVTKLETYHNGDDGK